MREADARPEGPRRTEAKRPRWTVAEVCCGTADSSREPIPADACREHAGAASKGGEHRHELDML
jgi:hypothetical protein